MIETITKKETQRMPKGYKELADIALELALVETSGGGEIPNGRFVVENSLLSDDEKDFFINKGIVYKGSRQKH